MGLGVYRETLRGDSGRSGDNPTSTRLTTRPWSRYAALLAAAFGLYALALADSACAAPPAPAYLSLIIDDLGQNLPRDRRALALPGPVTLAVMPDTPHAAEFAREAHKARKTVIIHMPMDPAGGPFAWRPDLPEAELQARLEAAIKAVPYAAGLNNHEGSRMTAQPQAMSWLMTSLQAHGLFFVDSRTSAKTVGAAKAQAIGLASVSRDVFLDDVRTPQAIAQQLQTAIEMAHRNGSVVMIGHPTPQTLEVLERELPKLKSQGVEWISIRLMIAQRSNRAMPAHGKDGEYSQQP
jgi:polysaccharide deacetylase 2 family uncharacterized protein YibQ